ncbi:gliding motility-associated ABC transporter ATP-binding subunit GldA [Marinoscillum sp. MHG1-6]|uniref:gliding motility-associated ABC transporter ATP-binding subunit GldA n=1 Tax=Marinoscillum sp. MHG1-6 TaxID=2959627 RepID=UPI00215705FC|nr:gliding motility-associated ABC transporter ATP-binding subunit GldA [Marinoscillum sp. MHG1-6]
MSVVISELTKIYGEQRAVDAISFEAPKGKVTGFLGPNGAGKSTTMKMAVGYVVPTSGSITLDGVSVTEDPLEVKKMTGYLPEHNPLYLDMYVREFLRFIGSAYGLKGSTLKHRVEEMIETVGLNREKKKKIGALSKGYRQRVGLAQALIHNPSVLILDEPTTGLDPNQILEIREVIKNISQDKTVILSTHIMQEVEAICDKVVIIDKGQIVADDQLTVLKEGMNDSNGIIITFEQAVDRQVFVSGGFEPKEYGENAYLIESDRDDLRAALLKITSENDLPLLSLTKAHKSLEEIFHRLTQNQKS